ncbi:hypothetical protein [Flaviflexus huanghaiensis]|uniref:hypothetical protein n=1 Tax=Flaviflexus huanghaiensis TaxID=1111473 RepID=UPI0015F847F0|nr:hypothetical protein [Flaviflexus huanghaiensis]
MRANFSSDAVPLTDVSTVWLVAAFSPWPYGPHHRAPLAAERQQFLSAFDVDRTMR